MMLGLLVLWLNWGFGLCRVWLAARVGCPEAQEPSSGLADVYMGPLLAWPD